jgi:hypothetical protein
MRSEQVVWQGRAGDRSPYADCPKATYSEECSKSESFFQAPRACLRHPLHCQFLALLGAVEKIKVD